jgi:hypothetical protein
MLLGTARRSRRTRRTAELLAEIAKYGTPTIKRAYGDWTTQQLAGWKQELQRHAIQPVQQFAYTRGKNSTDSALIIDAMDLLYAGNVEGFVLVSSDSDFTRLATSLRESAMTVYGLGRRSTPEAFVAACDRFIYLDLLSSEQQLLTAANEDAAPSRPDLEPVLSAAINSTAKDDGWSNLAEVGSYLSKSQTSQVAPSRSRTGTSTRVGSWSRTSRTGSTACQSFWRPWLCRRVSDCDGAVATGDPSAARGSRRRRGQKASVRVHQATRGACESRSRASRSGTSPAGRSSAR